MAAAAECSSEPKRRREKKTKKIIADTGDGGRLGPIRARTSTAPSNARVTSAAGESASPPWTRTSPSASASALARAAPAGPAKSAGGSRRRASNPSPSDRVAPFPVPSPSPRVFALFALPPRRLRLRLRRRRARRRGWNPPPIETPRRQSRRSPRLAKLRVWMWTSTRTRTVHLSCSTRTRSRVRRPGWSPRFDARFDRAIGSIGRALPGGGVVGVAGEVVGGEADARGEDERGGQGGTAAGGFG